ncbi:hypothetical protein [Cellulophaga lytica]|uniref:hypothetical protein n=1 Tax=Cellulophaga lytica TaxID=979 RepID=UPI003CE47C0A
MSKYKYGIKSFIVDNIDPANGNAAGTDALDITPEIFRDSFDMTEEDGTETDIYSEMDNTPKLSFLEPGKETLTFELLDTRPEMLERFLGGTVVEAAGKKTWSKPANQGIIEKHLTITLLDDTIMTIPRAKVVAKKNFTFRRNAPWTLEVNVTVLTPEVGSLAAIDISEPTA